MSGGHLGAGRGQGGPPLPPPRRLAVWSSMTFLLPAVWVSPSWRNWGFGCSFPQAMCSFLVDF